MEEEKKMTSMTVGDLCRILEDFHHETPVILQKDADANSYSPAWGAEAAIYRAETTWMGECERVPEDPPGATGNCVVIYPVN